MTGQELQMALPSPAPQSTSEVSETSVTSRGGYSCADDDDDDDDDDNDNDCDRLD